MAVEQHYTGPYQVVARFDGDDSERLINAGVALLEDALRLARMIHGRHVRHVVIQDEPTRHTVAVVMDRDHAQTPSPSEDGDNQTTHGG